MKITSDAAATRVKRFRRIILCRRAAGAAYQQLSNGREKGFPKLTSYSLVDGRRSREWRQIFAHHPSAATGPGTQRVQRRASASAAAEGECGGGGGQRKA